MSGFESVVDPQIGKMVQKPIYDPEIKQAVDGLYHTVVNADQALPDALAANRRENIQRLNLQGLWRNLPAFQKGCISLCWLSDSAYSVPRQRSVVTQLCRHAVITLEPDVYTKGTMVVEFPIRAAHAG